MGINDNLEVEELPKPIRLAALDVATQYASLGIFSTKEAQAKRQELNLWLMPSWRKARSLGSSEECFAELVRVDSWNISSNSKLFEDFQRVFALLGNDSWKLFACKMVAEQAIEEIKEVGVVDFVSGLDAVIALQKMSKSS